MEYPQIQDLVGGLGAWASFDSTKTNTGQGLADFQGKLKTYLQNLRPDLKVETEFTVPGTFRPSKCWDIVARRGDRIVLAIELKSIRTSFGNNFNNRVEEALGSAYDMRASFPDCSLVYILIVADCQGSRKLTLPPKVHSHTSMIEIWKETSYLKRFQIFCQKMNEKKVYDYSVCIKQKTEITDQAEENEEIKILRSGSCSSAASTGNILWSDILVILQKNYYITSFTPNRIIVTQETLNQPKLLRHQPNQHRNKQRKTGQKESRAR